MGEAYRGFWGGVLPFMRVEFLDSFDLLMFFRRKRQFLCEIVRRQNISFRGGQTSVWIGGAEDLKDLRKWGN